MGSYVPNTSRRVLGILVCLFWGEASASQLPRVLFFQYFRFLKSFSASFFSNFISFGHFCILRNKMLCPEDRRPLPGGAVHFPSPGPPPSPPSQGGGVRTNFRDLDPVWERERERVNRDALTRLKTPEGSADFCFAFF